MYRNKGDIMLSIARILFAFSLCLGVAHAAEGDATPVLGEQTKIGSLAAKTANTSADVVAVLQSGGAEYHLVAAGASATQIQELLLKNLRVQVTGPVNGDKMTVSSIKEAPTELVANKGDDTGDKKAKKKAEKKKKKKEAKQ